MPAQNLKLAGDHPTTTSRNEFPLKLNVFRESPSLLTGFVLRARSQKAELYVRELQNMAKYVALSDASKITIDQTEFQDESY